MPTIDRDEPTSQDRRDERTDVDRDIIELEGNRLAPVAAGVERLDLRRKVATQQPGASDQQGERREEGAVKGEREFPPPIGRQGSHAIGLYPRFV